MSLFNGLGAFAGGVAQGVGMRAKIDEIKDKRDAKKAEKSINDAMKQAADELFKDEGIQVQDPANGGMVAQPSQPSQQNPIGLDSIDFTGASNQQPQPIVNQQPYPDYTATNVQKFADGGLAQDPKSFVTQVNEASGLNAVQPQQQPPQKQKQNKSDYGYKLSKVFNAGRDAALKAGRPDLAMDYQNAGFQIRDRLFKEGAANAQRQFDMTGDIGGFVKIYNDAIDDGASVDGYEKTENGYKLRINNNGNIVEQEFKPDQIRDLVMTFNDPGARYAAERQAIDARNKKSFETDEEIRKNRALENDKTHSYGLDNVIVKGGKVVYDGSANKQQIKDSNSANAILASRDPSDPLYQQAQRFLELDVGQRERVARATKSEGSAKEPKDWNKEMLPVLKEIGDNILGFEGMGTQDINTGKVTPTKQGNEALVFGQRLIKANPDLLPADIAKLSHMAATNPQAIDYQVIERPDGSRYKRQVIKQGGQIYQLANTGGQNIPSKTSKPSPKPTPQASKPQQNPQPRQPQKLAPSRPQTSSGLSLMEKINQGKADTRQLQQGEEVSVGLDSVIQKPLARIPL